VQVLTAPDCLVEPAGEAELNESVRRHGSRHAIGDLITCSFYLTVWANAGLVAGLVFAPRATRVAATVLTLVAAADGFPARSRRWRAHRGAPATEQSTSESVADRAVRALLMQDLCGRLAGSPCRKGVGS
jgi:hypothetical protein